MDITDHSPHKKNHIPKYPNEPELLPASVSF